MAINDYFFNAIKDGEGNYDRIYNASDFVGYLDKIVGSGVFPTPSDQLQVRAGTGMQIIVNEGQGWIKGHKLVNTSDFPLELTPAHALLNRIDRVIFYSDESERAMGIEIKTGTPAANPTAPTLTRNTTRYEMCLAQIKVNKGSTTITNSAITDTRANTNLCGWVAGLIQQIDTSTLFIQWDTAYSEFMAQMESWKTYQQHIFEEWMASLTQELQVGAYIRKFVKTVNGGANVSNMIPLDMVDYVYHNTDIFIPNLNGLILVPGTDYVVDTTSTPPVFELNSSLTSGNKLEIVVLKSVLGTPIEDDGDAVLY